MIRLLWTASAEVRYFLRCYMPSNILLDLIRTRKGLKWGVPAMLLAGPYQAIAFWCTTLIENGGPGWLHLVVLLCIWNALKMMAIGPVSVVLVVMTVMRVVVSVQLVSHVVTSIVTRSRLLRISTILWIITMM